VTKIDLDSPSVIEINDDPAGDGRTDGILAGRPTPFGTYNWFFPNGTTATVSGRNNSQVRLQLSQSSAAWVDVTGVKPLPAGTPPLLGTVLPLRLQPHDESVVLRIPLPGPIPFRVDEDAHDLRLMLYGVAADMDWIHYGGNDPLVRLIVFSQPREDETVVTVSLSTEVWGYRTLWDGNDLLFEVRRPPQINPRRPLEAQVIALDAGHPPLGATGPTGVREPDVTLGVARKAAEILERYGAQVVLTRDGDGPLDLFQRTRAAEVADAVLLVSIHANALPDGVNPFVNNGTSVFYFHPRSVELARELNRALVRQFGFPDLGIGRGDLALARPTWMPAALTEGLFLMIPEQEAVLASEAGQLRYARGIVDGIAAFLRQHSVRGN
jgi:N-acetylmuramoyl-L-alanine amidase